MGDISLDGKEYSGRKVSKASLFGSDQLNGFAAMSDDGDGSDDSEINEEPSASHETDDDNDDEDDDEVSEEEFVRNRQKKNGKRKSRDVEGDSDQDDEEVEEEYSSDEDHDEDAAPVKGKKRSSQYESAELDQLERELQSIQESEATAAAHLKERAVRERQKALAVKAQKTVWNKALETRILLQKSLQGANKLPEPESQAALIAADEGLEGAYASLATQAAETLGSVLSLLESITAQNPAVAEAGDGAAANAVVGNGASGGVDALWEKWEGVYQQFVPFRDASIDRWHRKTVLTAGK